MGQTTQLLASLGSACQCVADRPHPPMAGQTSLSQCMFQCKNADVISDQGKVLPRRRQLFPGLSDLFVLKLVSIRSTGVEILRGDIRKPAEQNNLLDTVLLKLQEAIRTAGRAQRNKQTNKQPTNKQTVTLHWS